MARTMLDLVALLVVFGALAVYEHMLRLFRPAARARTQPAQREAFENAEWEAVLRTRCPSLDAATVADHDFAESADRPVITERLAGVAGMETAIATAEEQRK